MAQKIYQTQQLLSREILEKQLEKLSFQETNKQTEKWRCGNEFKEPVQTIDLTHPYLYKKDQVFSLFHRETNKKSKSES